MLRRTLAMFLMLGVCLPWQAGAGVADAPYGVASRAGVIQSLDFAAATMVISGSRYSVAIDAKVEIGGSYGAFTMLRPGMRVRYDYLVISDTARRIVLIQELPPNVTVDEV